MHGFRRNDPRLVLALVLGLMAGDARAENLGDAWAIALGTNAQLQASRQTSEAAGQELASSRSARLPQIQTLNGQAFLTNPISVPSSSGQPKAASGGQEQFTISAVAAIVPIYTGGRIRNTIASNTRPVERVAGRRGHHGPGPEARGRPRLRGRAAGESGRRRGAEQRRQPHGPGPGRGESRHAGPGHPQRPARRAGRPRQRPAARDPGAQPAQHRLGDLQPLPLPPDGHRRPARGAGAGAAPAPRSGDAADQAMLMQDAGTDRRWTRPRSRPWSISP